MGYISGVHGLKGWVKVFSWTEPRAAILDYRPWLIGEELRPVDVLQGRVEGKNVLAALPDVHDRNAARDLVGQPISVRRDQLPELAAGEYYWADLIGLSVVTVEGAPLGEVTGLLETGANDVLVVKGDRQRLIPYVPGQYVVRIERDARRMIVDWDADF